MQQRLHIDRLHNGSQIRFFAVKQSPRQKSIFARTLCLFDQIANGFYIVADGVTSRSHHGTLDGYPVGKSGKDIAHGYLVAVVHPEIGKLQRIHRIYFHLACSFAAKLHVLLICFATEPAGKTNQVVQRFVFFHLIPHGALHLARYLSQHTIGIHLDNIAVAQGDIPRIVAVHQVFVNIDDGLRLSGTKNADRAQTPDSVDSSRCVQRMESRSKRREGIRTRRHHLTHHVHTNGTHVSHRYGQESTRLRRIQIGVNRRKGIAQMCRCLIHPHSTQLYASQSRYGNMPVGSNGIPHVQFGIAPYIDDDLVARTQDIVGRRRHIHVRFEGEVMGGEKILPENAVLLWHQFLRSGSTRRYHHFRRPPCLLHETRRSGCGQFLSVAVSLFQTLELIHGDPFFCQFQVNLFLCHSGIAVVPYVLQYLFVAHLRKKRNRDAQKTR